MRWNGFVGSLVFGGVAALLYQPFLLWVGPTLGYRAAAAGFTILAATSYVAGSTKDTRRGLGGAFLLGTVATFAAWVSHSPVVVAVLTIAGIGVVRSALLYSQPLGRTIFVEAALLMGSLAVGSYLVGTGPLGGAMAVWGVFLVQSVYYLIGGTAIAARTTVQRDPFDSAFQRAQRLLET
ncbi:MAG: hypothetical protein AAF658_07300 [Myxococcota bacterium]